jgi:predicted DCC family thiol-disulfide oxidoreductase YuxK
MAGMRITLPPSRGVLLYDADCGFCTRAALFLAARRPLVAVRPMAAADLDALGVDAVRARREIPLLRGDGTLAWGARAIGEALACCPAPWRWAGRVILAPVAFPLSARVYAWVSEHRGDLPGGTGACQV